MNRHLLNCSEPCTYKSRMFQVPERKVRVFMKDIETRKGKVLYRYG